MKKVLLVLIFLAVFSGLIIPNFILGQEVIVIQPPIEHRTFTDLIGAIINFIFGIALVVAPLMIIIGAFYFLASGGDPKNIETGKKIIIYTLIGFVIILLANGLVDLLRNILRVET